MDARDAREIIKKVEENYKPDNAAAGITIGEYLQAKGYLEALNGPEVKELVWALIRIKEHAGGECSFPGDIAEDALKTYKEGVGKPGEGVKKSGGGE